MKYLVASALALVIAAPAAAQTERAVNSGVRVEGRVGWDRATFKEKIDAPTVVVTDKVSKSGVAWGLEAGYDYVTSGPLLIGGYAGIEGSTVEDCFGPNGRRVCTELGRNITVGARAGYVLRRGVIYLKGGYSNGRVTRTPGFAGDPTLPPPPPPGAGDPTL
ncbi:outer membrane beta-barrel protein, partial [Sphingomonas sp. 3-13AW]|uniref:outer membrane beta-barrel protein n=1 Tax=Sphingomonas sp. 3-13AW TaxID=3050450 RepID=UPI003BB67C71